MSILLFKIGGLFLLLIAMLFAIHHLARRFHWRAEWQRKALHIAVGSTALTFPWLFDQAWQVITVGTIGVTIMLALRTVPILRLSLGRCVHDVNRSSLGELYLSSSIVMLFWLTNGEGLHYFLPLLILTFADASAALVGIHFGKHRFVLLDGTKSWEGTATFAIIAFGLSLWSLAQFTGLFELAIIGLALSVTCLSMLIELVAWRGLDNLLLPLGVYLALDPLLVQESALLLDHLLVFGSLLVLVLVWDSRCSLHLRVMGVLQLTCLLIGGPLLWLAALLAGLYCHHLLARILDEYEIGIVGPLPGYLWLGLARG